MIRYIYDTFTYLRLAEKVWRERKKERMNEKKNEKHEVGKKGDLGICLLSPSKTKYTESEEKES